MTQISNLLDKLTDYAAKTNVPVKRMWFKCQYPGCSRRFQRIISVANPNRRIKYCDEHKKLRKHESAQLTKKRREVKGGVR